MNPRLTTPEIAWLGAGSAVALLLGLSATIASAAVADSEQSRAAARIITHIAGQLASLGSCASADPPNAVAYRAAATNYHADDAVKTASDMAEKILAEDARRLGRSDQQSADAESQSEAAVSESLHRAATADPGRFVAECRDELQHSASHTGSFAPLDDLFPYEMKLLRSSGSAP